MYVTVAAAVRGEPNVAYICSRYYRAPELIFGATDYTVSIGMSRHATFCCEHQLRCTLSMSTGMNTDANFVFVDLLQTSGRQAV
jgi:hypothetical protein